MIQQDIGQIIRLTRDSQGITQRELAEKAGIRQATIVEIESGKGNCRLSTLFQIAEALNCELEIKLRRK